MNVLIVPDKFKGTSTATEVAEAIGQIFGKSHKVIIQPLADGGDGTLEAFGGGSRSSFV